MADEVVTSPEPEPEGAIEVDLSGAKQKVVPVSAVIAERKRAAEKTAAEKDREYEPIKAKAAQVDQLSADLAAIQPHVKYLQEHPELLKRDESPAIQQVNDDEAKQFAERFQLFTPTGYDIAGAKKIIAHQRAEMIKVATEAAQQAVRPATEATARMQAGQNFLWAANQRNAQGQPLVDPQILAQVFGEVSPELTADPKVAAHLLDTAIGRAARAGKVQPSAPLQEPTFTETAGGHRGGTYQMSEMEKTMAKATGVKEEDWKKTAAKYNPDAINVLGE